MSSLDENASLSGGQKKNETHPLHNIACASHHITTCSKSKLACNGSCDCLFFPIDLYETFLKEKKIRAGLHYHYHHHHHWMVVGCHCYNVM